MKQQYTFFDSSLYKQALTHKSAGTNNNERLEFFGDALINCIVAEAVYHKFPYANEGELSRLRSQLVKQETLASIARELKLGDQLILGSGELKSGGYRRDSILSDALEAVIAAIYLDSGSMETCKKNVLPWFNSKIEKLSLDEEYRDSKTQLQEWLQSRKYPVPCYEILEESGADNERVFTVSCSSLASQESAVAKAGSKKQAEQNAAAQLLALLQTQQMKKPAGKNNV